MCSNNINISLMGSFTLSRSQNKSLHYYIYAHKLFIFFHSVYCGRSTFVCYSYTDSVTATAANAFIEIYHFLACNYIPHLKNSMISLRAACNFTYTTINGTFEFQSVGKTTKNLVSSKFELEIHNKTIEKLN